VLLPDADAQPWQVHLDYLHLPAAAAHTAPVAGANPPINVPTNVPSALDDIDPNKVIPLDLRIGDCGAAMRSGAARSTAAPNHRWLMVQQLNR